MMRGSVSMLGSPLESPMILRPAARALRTRSVISTVAEGLKPRKRSLSGFGMSHFALDGGEATHSIMSTGSPAYNSDASKGADVAAREVSHAPLVSPRAAAHRSRRGCGADDR